MANKTFLELCQQVCREGSVPGGADAISGVSGNNWQLSRIVGYVQSEWVKLQNRHTDMNLHWRWMRAPFTLTTVASQDAYSWDSAAIVDDLTATQITRFKRWFLSDYDDPPRIYLQSAGQGTQTWLNCVDWNDFKYMYRVGTQNEGVPAHVSVNPQNQIVFGPVPNDIYVMNADYLRGPSQLVNDGDQPDLPEAFDEVIVFGALSRYGLQKNAPEVITYAQDELATLLGDLEGDQLAEICIGAPLA